METKVGDREGNTVTLVVSENTNLLLAKRSLVGKVLTNKMLNRGAVKAILLKAWGEPDGVQVTDMGTNLFLFTFPTVKDTIEVATRSPWYVMNHLLSLQRWIPQASIYEIDFDWVPFWVQLHALPLEFMNDKNAATLAEQMGEVIEVENHLVNGALLRTFMRVKVNINITQPLITGCWVPRKDLPKSWILFRYERLQDFCFTCGLLGHDQKACKKEKLMAVHCENSPRFDAKLGVPPARTLASLCIEQRQRNKEQTQGGPSSESSGEEPWWRKEARVRRLQREQEWLNRQGKDSCGRPGEEVAEASQAQGGSSESIAPNSNNNNESTEVEPLVGKDPRYRLEVNMGPLPEASAVTGEEEHVDVLNFELKPVDHERSLSHRVAERWEKVKEVMLGGEGENVGGNKEDVHNGEERGDWEEGSTFIFGSKIPILEIPEDNPDDVHQQADMEEGESWGFSKNFGSLTFSKEDIDRCREECRREFEKWTEVRDGKMKKDDGKEGGPKEQLYFVDYPSDEEKGERGKECKIKEDDESQLVLNMNNTLSLKRRRKGLSSQALLEYDLEGAAKRRREEPLRGQGGEVLAMEIYEYGTMAEEAGLSMPPPGQ